jgi:hypothetical protein
LNDQVKLGPARYAGGGVHGHAADQHRPVDRHAGGGSKLLAKQVQPVDGGRGAPPRRAPITSRSKVVLSNAKLTGWNLSPYRM